MSVHNGELTLHKSVESILEQSFRDFEFIIVDDASSDDTSNILQYFLKKDNRIKILTNGKNRGLSYSLNLAFQTCKGRFIARMDADDVSFQDRFEKQIKHFNANRALSVLGTGARYVSPEKWDAGMLIKMPETHEHIIQFMFKSTPFIHPTVMMKREFLESLGGYDEVLRRVQDYDLWLRGRHIGCFGNLQEELLYYSYDKERAYKGIFTAFIIKMRSRPNIKELGISLLYSTYEVYKLLIFIIYRK